MIEDYAVTYGFRVWVDESSFCRSLGLGLVNFFFIILRLGYDVSKFLCKFCFREICKFKLLFFRCFRVCINFCVLLGRFGFLFFEEFL